MSRKRTIAVDGLLIDVMAERLKPEGATWNDVIARTLGYNDLKDFNRDMLLIGRLSSHPRCNKTIDMFGDNSDGE